MKTEKFLGKTPARAFSILVGLVCFLMSSGCRRSESRVLKVNELISKSEFVVFATSRLRTDLELEVVAADFLPISKKPLVGIVPDAGQVIDVIKFKVRPSLKPDSFVVFYREHNGGSDILCLSPVYVDKIASVMNEQGTEISVAELKEILRR